MSTHIEVRSLPDDEGVERLENVQLYVRAHSEDRCREVLESVWALLINQAKVHHVRVEPVVEQHKDFEHATTHWVGYARGAVKL